jgi:hypothetical protein
MADLKKLKRRLNPLCSDGVLLFLSYQERLTCLNIAKSCPYLLKNFAEAMPIINGVSNDLHIGGSL